MNSREAHKIWIRAVRGRSNGQSFSFGSRRPSIILSKLINFAAAASQHRASAQELPQFISEVGRMFTPEEIAAQLTRIERERNEMDKDVADEVGTRAAVRSGKAC